MRIAAFARVASHWIIPLWLLLQPVLGVASAQLGYAPGELIVKFAETAVPACTERDGWSSCAADVDQLLQHYPPARLDALFSPPPAAATGTGLGRIYKWTFAADTAVLEALSVFQRAEGIEYVHLNHRKALAAEPNDPQYDQQWAHRIILSELAWEVQRGTASVVIAVIDTGIDLDHEDLAAAVWRDPSETENGRDDDGDGYVDDVRGWDFSDNDNDPEDDGPAATRGHGTHTAGIAAAVTDNATGVAGMSWGCRIMPLKIFPNAYADVSARAMVYAADHGAQIINCSYGAPQFSPLEAEAVAYARSTGALVIAAAGNSGQERVDYPAAYTGVMAVGATGPDDTLAPTSNYGSQLSLCAPGSSILSTWPDNSYAPLSGTSTAAPLVSGLAALVLSGAPELTPEEVQARLLGSAVNIDGLNPGFEGKLGAGRVNALGALLSEGYLEISHYELVDLDGDGDGQLDAGETAAFSVTLRNDSWKSATGVSVTLTSSSPDLTILDATRPFPDIAPYTSADCEIPFVILASANNRLNIRIEIDADIASDEGANQQQLELIMNNPRHLFAGWPYRLDSGTFLFASPVLADLDPSDGDAVDIILCDNEFSVRAVRLNGSLLPGWPVTVGDPGGMISLSTPAVGDVNGDGQLEIVGAGFYDELPGKPGLVTVFSAAGELASGWPRRLDGPLRGAPVLADLDNDGQLDVLAASEDQLLWAWRGSAEVIHPFPINLGLRPFASLAVADLTGDSCPEIIVAGISQQPGIPSQVVMLAADGSLLSGWPQDLPADPLASPIIADLDGGGDLELIASCTAEETETASASFHLFVWKANGQLLSGWPIQGAAQLYSSPAVGDVNGDGRLEIAAATLDGRIWLWDSQGQSLPGFPHHISGAVLAPLITVDVTGDGIAEILCGTEDGLLHAIEGDGWPTTGWPIDLGGTVLAAPTAGTLNSHGATGLFATGRDGAVWGWALRGSFDSAGVHWAKCRNDLRNSGCLPWQAELPQTSGCDLLLNQHVFRQGDLFDLCASLSNAGSGPVAVGEYIVLDVQGSYWFWPQWTTEFDGRERYLPPRRFLDEQILRFEWPSNAGAAVDIRLWLGILELPDLTLAGIDSVQFAFQ